jgi:hypothetical protein
MEHYLLMFGWQPRKGCERALLLVISNVAGTLYGAIFSSAEREGIQSEIRHKKIA